MSASSSMKGVVVPVTLVGLVSAGIVGYNVSQRPGWTQTCVDKSTNVRVDNSQCDTSNFHSGGHIYGWYYTTGGRYVSVGSRVPAGGTLDRPSNSKVASPSSKKSGVSRGGFGSSGMSSGSDGDDTKSRTGNSGSEAKSKTKSDSGSSNSKSKSKSGSSGSKAKSKSGGS